MTDIETLTRTFSHAASDLGVALTDRLKNEDPVMHAKVEQAVASGERLVISLEFSDTPAIKLQTLDDYERAKLVMTVHARMPGSRH